MATATRSRALASIRAEGCPYRSTIIAPSTGSWCAGPRRLPSELIKTVHENESVNIPIGAVRRLENPCKIQLELIEGQTGSYLGEHEDEYQRA
ncbi:hypothetical protein ACVWXL_005804 [Bradyrhizobium sp. GM22.5]